MFNSNIANTPLFKEMASDQMPDTLGETYGPGLQSDVKTQRWGLDSSNTTRFSNGLGEWTLRYGAAFQHEDTAPNSPVLPVDYNNNRYLRSGTRREELLLKQDVLQKVWVLRKLLYPMDELEATEFLVDKLRATKNNNEFFDSMRRG